MTDQPIVRWVCGIGAACGERIAARFEVANLFQVLTRYPPFAHAPMSLR
jgi:hypothetical protein